MGGEWSTWTIDEIKADQESAIAIGPFGSRLKADRYTASGVPVIRGNNISDTRSLVGDLAFVSEETADELRSSNVFPDDLVFPHRGAIGQVGIVPHGAARRYVLSTSLMKLSCNKALVDPLFVFYFFRSNQGRQALLQYASTVGPPGIGQPLTSLRSISLRMPPLPEQRAIAHILGTLDDKIELNRRMNETFEEMAQALFECWFIDCAPVHAKAALRNHTPNHSPLDWTVERARAYLDRMGPSIAALFPDRFADSELGEIPERWRVRTLGDCFHLTMGQSPPGNTYNDDGNGLPFFQGSADFGFRYPKNKRFCSAPTRIAEQNDTLVSVRAPVGDINMALEKCCIGRGVAALRHKSGLRSFTYYSIRAIQQELRQYEHTGTVFGAINKKQFEMLKTVEPPQELIRAFESLIGPMDEHIKTHVSESRTLIALRDALLSKLVSGEVRIRNAEDSSEV